MTKPLVSVLCATANRPEFMPWLAWNWQRQTYENRELILVETDPGLVPGRVWTEAGLRQLPGVRYVVTTKTSIGEKLQLALELATGQYVMIWCDDDWQHPERIERSVDAITRLATVDVTGWNTGHFLSLAAMPEVKISTYRNPKIVTSAVAATVKTELARAAGFRDEPCEDTRWIRRALDLATHTHTLEAWWPHSLWLVHDRNTTKRNYDWQSPEDAVGGQLIVDELTTLPLDVDGEPWWPWADTTPELLELKSRLQR